MIKSYDDNIEDCYIGSTKDFKGRKHSHKESCNNENSKRHNIHLYKFIRDNGGWLQFEMKPIEEFICDTKLQAAIREQHWINFYKSDLNSINSFMSDEDKKIYKYEYNETHKEEQKEYRETHKEKRKEYDLINKEKINEQHKEYYEINKDKIKLYNKEYNVINKDKIKEYRRTNEYEEKYKTKNNCECGGKYTNNHKKIHLNSQKHQNYLLNSSKTDNLNK